MNQKISSQIRPDSTHLSFSSLLNRPVWTPPQQPQPRSFSHQNHHLNRQSTHWALYLKTRNKLNSIVCMLPLNWKSSRSLLRSCSLILLLHRRMPAFFQKHFVHFFSFMLTALLRTYILLLYTPSSIFDLYLDLVYGELDKLIINMILCILYWILILRPDIYDN